MVFAGRADAGRRLAARLGYLRGEPVVVLGLPRGGIPVAFQVAQALGAPLEVIVVCKLGRPFPVQAGIAVAGTVDPSRRSEEVEPTAGAVWLADYTSVPEDARGIVVFAHGSGSKQA